MTADAHLWAIGYDDMDRAEQVRSEIARLGEKHCLVLLDTAVVVRYPDGCVALDRKAISWPAWQTGCPRRQSLASCTPFLPRFGTWINPDLRYPPYSKQKALTELVAS
jgi:hypothetical protein